MTLSRGSRTSDLRQVIDAYIRSAAPPRDAQALAEKFSLLRVTALADDTAIAINQQYVSVDADPELCNGDEVALIPPISGG